MNVLMVGVDNERIGGMWSVAENYITSQEYNNSVKMTYVATSTCGSVAKRIRIMLNGYKKVLNILRRERVDIVHIHMAEKGSVFRKGIVVYMAKGFHKKVIIQMHAGCFMDWYKKQSPLRKKVIKSILEKSDRVAVLGEYWKEQLSNLIEKKKIVVLYNGSPCPETNPYNADGKFILFLGLLKRTKGIYDLLKAVKEIKETLPKETKLYLCGRDEEGDIEEKIKELGLSDRVEMKGWINTEHRLELFSQACMCVLPSYYEALSMTVIESMCYGIPMLTTNISTMPELLGKSIETFAPGDVKSLKEYLLTWCCDKEERIRISREEFKRAKSMFSSEANVRNTIRIYSELIKEVYS